MDLGPLLPGRIPNALISGRLNASLQASHKALSDLQDQIYTGHRYSLPSDDPTASSKTISLQQLLDRKTQVVTNIQTDTSIMTATDTALATIADALNKATQLVGQGIGSASSPSEKQALAAQAQSLITNVINAGNSKFQGRYLFGGSNTTTPPFTLAADGSVRYNGDDATLKSFIDIGQLQSINVNGATGLGALSPPVGGDINPALTMQTQLSDLFHGQGVTPSALTVTVTNGPTTQTQTVDLSSAKSIADLKAQIENAFTPGSVTVSINANHNGIAITPAAGTVAVSDIAGGNTALNLGILSAATAQVNGTDLDPRMTLTTKLSDLNGGAGIGATAGAGLLISNGSTTKVVDVSSANTVEDLMNLLRDPTLNLSVDINAAGNGLAISSRLSGADFSIGENGGTNATSLGLRTMTASTSLASLNYGTGVPVNAGQSLQITRRDGTSVSVDLSGSVTVQDVMDKINAVTPGGLVATLNSVGNGISITDNSGTNPLTIDSSELGAALGLNGTESGTDPTAPLVGKDVNPSEAKGTFNALVRLQQGLTAQNDALLTRTSSLISNETVRLTGTQADLGTRMQTLAKVQNSVSQMKIQIQQSISDNYDTDMTQVVTDLVNQQTAYQAALKSAAQTMQLNLINYL